MGKSDCFQLYILQVAYLNLSSVNATSTVNKVLVLGEPRNTENDSTCVVTDDSSAWAFSKTFHAPIWLSTLASNSTVRSSNAFHCPSGTQHCSFVDLA